MRSIVFRTPKPFSGTRPESRISATGDCRHLLPIVTDPNPRQVCVLAHRMRFIIGDSPVKTLEKPACATAIDSAAASTLRGLVARVRPRNIVETGADGRGTTLTLAQALI